MAVVRSETLPIATAVDIVAVRKTVRDWAAAIGFGIVDQTKLVTAASELARNALDHGGGGRVVVETVVEQGRSGVRLTFSDAGPGIPDIDRAMQNGYSTSNGLGMGLPGSRRLVHDFDIQSQDGRGTTVTIARWCS